MKSIEFLHSQNNNKLLKIRRLTHLKQFFSSLCCNNLIIQTNMAYILPIQVVYFQFLTPCLVNPDTYLQSQSKSNENLSQVQPANEQKINLDNIQRFWHIVVEEIENNSKKIEKKVWSREQDMLLIELQQEGLSWIQISKKIQGVNGQVCKRRFNRIIAKQQKWPKQIDNRVLQLKEIQLKTWKQIYVILKKQFRIKSKTKLRQIKYRYNLYLNSNISKQNWSAQEDLKILNLVKELGRKWKKISRILVNRTQLQTKNRFYGTLLPIINRIQKKVNQNNQNCLQ